MVESTSTDGQITTLPSGIRQFRVPMQQFCLFHPPSCCIQYSPNPAICLARAEPAQWHSVCLLAHGSYLNSTHQGVKKGLQTSLSKCRLESGNATGISNDTYCTLANRTKLSLTMVNLLPKLHLVVRAGWSKY